MRKMLLLAVIAISGTALAVQLTQREETKKVEATTCCCDQCDCKNCACDKDCSNCASCLKHEECGDCCTFGNHCKGNASVEGNRKHRRCRR